MPDGTLAGPDIEYAPAFVAFRTSAIAQGERQVGDSVLPGREPDWGEVLASGSALLEQARDLRVLVTTLCAAVHKHGVPALGEGLQLLAGWLQDYWEEVHPQLEVEGELDPLMRSNVVAELADASGLVRVLRSVPFVVTPVGSVTVGEAEKILRGGSVDPSAVVQSMDALMNAAQSEAQRNADAFQAVRAGHHALGEIRRLFRERLDFEFWPKLELLEDLLAGLEACLPAEAEQQKQEADLDPVVDAAERLVAVAPVAAQRHGAGLPVQLASRDEAFQALALARRFFEEHEPSHPAALLIRRVEDLKDKDFLSLVQELMPDGLAQLRVLTGRAEE